MNKVLTPLIIVSVILFSAEMQAQCPDRPDAIVDFVNNDICEGEIVNVINKSNENGNQVYYIWTWDDGKIDTVYDKSTPNHIYTPPCTSNGTHQFDFRLDVKNKDKTCLSHYIQKPIYVYNKPNVKFVVNPDPLCLPATLASFTNQSCPSGLKYQWNFGDVGSGALNFDTLVNPKHDFKSGAGSYLISLIATSKYCGSAKFDRPLQVLEGPKASFVLNPDSACLPPQAEIHLLNNSKNYTSSKWTITPTTGWSWKLPYNSTSDAPYLFFNAPGKYTIKLEVQACGKDDTVQTIEIKELPIVNLVDREFCGAPFTLLPTDIVKYTGGKVLSYSWTFEGGIPGSSTLQNPGNVVFGSTGKHKVTLTVTNECGSVTKECFINLFEKPRADFQLDSLSNLNGCSPLTLFLQNNSVSANSYQWKIVPSTGYVLLSGSKLTDANVRLRFDTPGKYAVQLVASNNVCGNIADTLIKDITIKQGVSATLDTIVNQCSDYLFDPAKYSKILNANTITWEFFGGNPSTGSGSNPGPVQFSGLGAYKVILTASNECGAQKIERNFKILSMPMLNIVDTMANLAYCSPFEVTLIDSSKFVEKRKWTVTPATGVTFVSGSDTVKAPNIRFDQAGKYTIAYEGINECGKVQWSKDLEVKKSPKVTLDSAKSECDLLVFPSNSKVTYSGNIDSYNWTFQNGSIASAAVDRPGDVVFNTPGTFAISIKVYGLCGVDSAVQNVTVFKKSAVNLDSVPALICNSIKTIALVANPAGGVWSGNFITPSGIFSPINAPFGLNSVTYTAGSGSCETKGTTAILVQGNKVSAGVNRTICSSEGTQLLSATPIGGTWSGLGISDPVLGTFDPNIAGAGTHNLVYQFTDAITGCTNSDSISIKVNESPKALLDSIGLICIGKIVNFKSSSSNTKSASWDFGDGTSSVILNPSKTYSTAGSCTIRLIVESTEGCRDTTFKSITVTAPPTIAFSMGPKTGCYPFSVTFTNNSFGDQVSYLWNFGNGDTSVTKDPVPITYLQGQRDTLYKVKLTIKNGCATLSATDSVLVKPRPQVDFGTNVDDGCTPLLIKFSNISVGHPKTWKWDLGNGTSSSDSVPPNQIYTTDTIIKYYKIRLIAVNDCGIDSLEKTITVKPVKSRAFFNMDTTAGCAPLTVRLSNFSTLGTKVYYDFGDGSKSTNPDTSHTYINAGKYKIICYASDGCGYDSTIQYLDVLPAPKVQFSHLSSVCQNQEINFKNESVDIFATKWEFGDGNTTNLVDPSHVYAQAGSYLVTLTAKSLTTGCENTFVSTVKISETPKVSTSISSTDGCMPLNASLSASSSTGKYFKWDFGDGNTSISNSLNHIFADSGAFFVKLRVTDSLGCYRDTLVTKIIVYPIPQSKFSYAQKEICSTPSAVNLTNESTGADAYVWNFGNNMFSTVTNPTVTYDQPTEYIISLISSNQYGCQDTFLQKIKLYQKPIADFDVQPQVVCLGERINIKNLSVALNHFKWSFGDGTTSEDSNPSYVYPKPGTYTISLAADFDGICKDSLVLVNTVTVLTKPSADFAWKDSLVNGSNAGIVVFSNLSLNANSYNWDFGDSQTSKVPNPIHRYYFNNVKTVRLIASNTNGCMDTSIQKINAKAIRGLFVPTAFSPENGVGDVRLFKPVGVGIKSYLIEVFSSFGQRVWYSDKLVDGQPSESWDGTVNGQVLPQDVYVWKVAAAFDDGTIWSGNGKEQSNSSNVGTVTLLR